MAKASNPLTALQPNELLSEATAQSQMDDGLTKALVAADKAKNRAKSVYGRRVVSMIRTDVLRLQKLLKQWERHLGECL